MKTDSNKIVDFYKIILRKYYSLLNLFFMPNFKPISVIDDNIITNQLIASGEFIVLKKGYADSVYIQVIKTVKNPVILFTANPKHFRNKLKDTDKVVGINSSITTEELNEVVPKAKEALRRLTRFAHCHILNISPLPEAMLIGWKEGKKRVEYSLI
jgi:hypothetical protein